MKILSIFIRTIIYLKFLFIYSFKMTEKNTKKDTIEHNETVESTVSQLEKKVAEVEKKAEKLEWKADKEVEKIVWKMWFVDKIIKASWIKEILNLSFMESANKRVRKYLEKICKILWWLFFIIWCIFVIWWVIATIGWIIALFRKEVVAFIAALLLLVVAIITVIMGRGLIKMKKWFPAASIICFALLIVWLIISVFTKNFGSCLLSIIISFVWTLFILKNKDMFKN